MDDSATRRILWWAVSLVTAVGLAAVLYLYLTAPRLERRSYQSISYSQNIYE